MLSSAGSRAAGSPAECSGAAGAHIIRVLVIGSLATDSNVARAFPKIESDPNFLDPNFLRV